MFTNIPVDPRDLPAIEKVEFTGLEKDYLWMRITFWALLALLSAGVLVIGFFIAKWPLILLLGFWALLFAVILGLEIAGFRIKAYALREKDISYKKGLIFFSMISIPFNRIQHCEVNQGPLARLFDLGSVKIYTAGGSMSDLSIGGLKKEAAHRLRDHISRLSSEYE